MNRVEYSGTNIECTGEKLRRKDGKVTDNMMKVVQIQVSIYEVKLMVHKGKVITMEGQNLGSYAEGHGYVGQTTIAWEVNNEKKCQKVAVREMEMKSYDNKIWFNHEHMVQLKRGAKTYDSECKVAGYVTDIPGVYMTTEDAKTTLPLVSEASVKYNAHVQVQLNYIDSEVMRKLKDRYKISVDPQCQELHAATIHKTIRTDENTFVRNVGDATVQFECARVFVKARNPDGQCYKQLPVEDEEGLSWFLDPQTRILVTNGTSTICSLSSVPILRSTEGEFVGHVPEARLVKIRRIDGAQEEDTKSDEKGIYAEQVVDSWLLHAWIQDYQESYAADIQRRTGQGYELFEEAKEMNDVFTMVREFNVKKLMKELTIEKVGGLCSIIVVAAVSVYVAFKIIVFVMKFIIIYGSEESFYLAACRAMCTEIHIVQEDSNVRIRIKNAKVDDQVETLKVVGNDTIRLDMEEDGK